jgi:hypothetical protein
MVRAKLMLSEVLERHYRPDYSQKTFVFTAQYDDKIEEDRRFMKASPTGRFEITVDNPAAIAQFEVGKSYYIDFSPVD